MNALTAVLADVGDDSVAVFESFGFGNLRYAFEDVSYNAAGLPGDFVSGADVSFGDDENVNGRFGVDVTER